MNRYGRTGLRVLGGLLALVLAATLLPAAVYAAGGAYQVDEDSVYMNMEDSRPAALAAQVSRAPSDNVTMQLFNYTGAINGQGPLEFYHSWGASVEPVVTQLDGAPLGALSAVEVGPDGKVYFAAA